MTFNDTELAVISYVKEVPFCIGIQIRTAAVEYVSYSDTQGPTYPLSKPSLNADQ